MTVSEKIWLNILYSSRENLTREEKSFCVILREEAEEKAIHPIMQKIERLSRENIEKSPS